MNDLRFQPGDAFNGRRTKKGRAPHRFHAITVTDVEPIGEEYDRVAVTCECGAAWSFMHWWCRPA